MDINCKFCDLPVIGAGQPYSGVDAYHAFCFNERDIAICSDCQCEKIILVQFSGEQWSYKKNLICPNCKKEEVKIFERGEAQQLHLQEHNGKLTEFRKRCSRTRYGDYEEQEKVRQEHLYEYGPDGIGTIQ